MIEGKGKNMSQRTWKWQEAKFKSEQMGALQKGGVVAGTSVLGARCFAAKKLQMNQSHVNRFIRFP